MLAAPFMISPTSTTKATTATTATTTETSTSITEYGRLIIFVCLGWCSRRDGFEIMQWLVSSCLILDLIAESSSRSPNFSKFCRQQVSNNFPLSPVFCFGDFFVMLGLYFIFLVNKNKTSVESVHYWNPYSKKHIPKQSRNESHRGKVLTYFWPNIGRYSLTLSLSRYYSY